MSSINLTTRGKLILIVPIYLFIGAYFLSNPFMAVIGTGILSVFVYSHTYLSRKSSSIKVDTKIKQDTAYVDEGVKISHKIESQGPVRLSLKADDPDMETDDKSVLQRMLNSKILFEYPVYPTSSGRAKMGALTGTIYDPMGLYKSDFKHPSQSEMVVYPSKDTIRHAKAYAHRVHLEELVEDIQRFTTTSEELEEIREYQPGDKLRDIHWKSVSKFGKLMTKEYEKMALLECSIFLDMSPSMRRGKKKHNHVTFLTLELLKELELSGHDIGLTVYDHRNVLFYQKPDKKRTTFPRIYKAISDLPGPKKSMEYNELRYDKEITMDTLKDAELQFLEQVNKIRFGGKSKRIGGLVNAIREIKRGVNKRSLIVFITDMETDPGLVIKSVEKLKAMNHAVWVIIPFSPWYEVEEVDEEKLKMAFRDYIKLEKMIHKLFRAGAKVFEIYPGKEGLRILEEGR